MNSTSRLLRGPAVAPALFAQSARADQIGQFCEPGSAPGLFFTGLVTAGGTIVGLDGLAVSLAISGRKAGRN